MEREKNEKEIDWRLLMEENKKANGKERGEMRRKMEKRDDEVKAEMKLLIDVLSGKAEERVDQERRKVKKGESPVIKMKNYWML